MNNKYKAYIVAGAGFIMILINTLSYIMDWETKFIPIGIFGIVFIVIGRTDIPSFKVEAADQPASINKDNEN